MGEATASSSGARRMSGGSDDGLLARARSVRQRAYAPYSHFLVGAALVTDDGRVFEGCNVENASYGLAMCAERVAATTAVAAGARRIETIVVTSSAPEPASPCGACRQFLHEFNPEMHVISVGSTGHRKEWRLSELLRDPFGPGDLDSAT